MSALVVGDRSLVAFPLATRDEVKSESKLTCVLECCSRLGRCLYVFCQAHVAA